MKKTIKKINFALIGCGRIAARHFAAMEKLPQIQLRAVCDIKEGRAKEAAKKYKVDWYTDYRQLLKRNDIDVVSICTPNGLHVPMGMAAASAGKNVLLEKPLGIKLGQVDKMLRYFQQKQKKLFVVLQVRFNPPLQFLKQLIVANKLGRLYNAALVVRWFRPQSYFDNDKWRGTKRLDGGSLLNQGIHYIDVLQWLLGPVKSVFAKKDRVAHKIEVEDIVVAILQFKNNAYATIEFTICTYQRNLECSISILGSKGTVKIGGQAVDKIEVWEVENLNKPKLLPCLKPNVYSNGLYRGSCPNHIYVYQELVNHFNNEKYHIIDGFEARNSLEIVEAIYLSALRKKEIKLPLKNLKK